MRSGKSKKVIIFVALATIFSLWFDLEVTGGLLKALNSRKLAMSLNLGNGECEWRPAVQWTDSRFPTNAKLTKTIIAGYPSGDKRLTYVQLEGLTGLSARDEWDFKFIAMTNQPFIKANYPHHEGIWGWGDLGDQVIMVVSEMQKVMVEYHDILWDLGYAQTFEEAYERIENLYKEEERGEDTNPPVEEFLVWRDLRVLDEVHWYSWFIDYYMEAGLMRDMFTHEMTLPAQWQMAILPNFFTKFEMRYGRFVDENTTVTPSYDPMCATLSRGCYPVLVVDPAKLSDPVYGAAESRKIAQAVNGTEGFDDWMIEEEAWECIWTELIINKKGHKTFLDRNIDYDEYTLSFEMKNEMWHETNRLIEKYDVYPYTEDQVAVDLVTILKGHLEDLDVTNPADPVSYEDLMSYHLAFPPFFPNQKAFVSDDDFYVKQHERYEDIDNNYETVIDRRRKWFEEEMEKKRKRTVTVKYYDATGWNSLPGAGLASLVPYDTGKTSTINYGTTDGEFANSGRDKDVAALFSSHLYIDQAIRKLCVTSDDGSKLYLDNALVINNDGLHGPQRRCADVNEGVYKFDLEYFERFGGATLLLQFGPSIRELRTVPPRSWASEEGMRRYRELMRLNDLLEEDLKVLKETDIMGPVTRAEFNRRKKLERAATGPTVTSESRKLVKEALHDFTNFDEIRQLSKPEQLKLMRSMFGG